MNKKETDKTTDKTIGRNIYYIRHSQISNEQKSTKQKFAKVIAKKAGITPIHLCNIENSKAHPRLETLRNIAKALDVPTSIFFTKDITEALKKIDAVKRLSNSIMNDVVLTRDDLDMLGYETLIKLCKILDHANVMLNASRARRNTPFFVTQDLKEKMKLEYNNFDYIVNKAYQKAGVTERDIPISRGTLKKIAETCNLVIEYNYNFEDISKSSNKNEDLSQILFYYRKKTINKNACFYITNKLFGEQIKFRAAFGICYHLFMTGDSDVLNLLRRLGAEGDTAESIEKNSLPHHINIILNILAARLIIPSEKLQEECLLSGYDIEYLSKVFNVSWETMTMRLAYIGNKNISFHWIKMDNAGNFTKAITYDDLDFIIPGPACNKWGFAQSLLSPANITTQLSRHYATGKQYLCVSKVIQEYIGAEKFPLTFVICIGCPLEDAKKIKWIYLNKVNLDYPVEIGSGCAICDLTGCENRGVPFMGNDGSNFIFYNRFRQKSPFAQPSEQEIQLLDDFFIRS